MNSICVNCKFVFAIRPSKCSNCNGKTFEETLAEPTTIPKAVAVASSIKDKITPGKWFVNDYYVRVEFQTAPIGQAFVAIIPGPHNNFAEDKEGKANARLFSKSKEMLDILERLAVIDVTIDPDWEAKYYQLTNDAINLLKELNHERR